jgi:hypothetical protein
VEIQSTGSTTIAEFHAVNPLIAASGTARIQFGAGVVPASTEVYDSDLYFGSFPAPFLLGGGHKILVKDGSSVDNDSDAWEVTIVRNQKGAGGISASV